VANLVRAAVDATVIAWLASRILGRDARVVRRYLVLALMGIVVMIGAALPAALAARVLWSAVATLGACVTAWRLLLDRIDRDALSAEAAAAWARLRSFPA
jgi:hypothetical protein